MVSDRVGQPPDHLTIEPHGFYVSRTAGPKEVDGLTVQGREVSVEELEVGDLVEVHWLDASEARRPLGLPEREFDTPVRSIGVFGGLRGLRTRHIIIIKEVFMPGEPEYHYNAIPIGMVERILLAARGWWKKREVKKAMKMLDEARATAYAILRGTRAEKKQKKARPAGDEEEMIVVKLVEWDLDGLLALRDFWLRGKKGHAR